MLKCFDLTGKVAVVTGGNRGLGLSMARGLAESGADLFLIATNAKSLEHASAELSKAYGVTCHWAVADITNEVQVEQAVQSCIDKFGVIDILINNAATDRVPQSPEEADLGLWRRVIEINITGPFIVAQAVGRRMIAAGRGGKIVNIASISGYIFNGIVKAGSYDVSKHGVVALTRALAVEWVRYGIHVNAIAPGYFMTDPNRKACDEIPGLEQKITKGILLGRWGNPDELKGVTVLLSSDAANYMNGSIVFCDGGVTII